VGFLTELGPFRPTSNGKLLFNEFSWNKLSNVVFIEVPCGVGFSYSSSLSDYVTGDEMTAVDNYQLIQLFFKRFPEYLSNDLYLISESYGGHYLPMLAKVIVDNNGPSSGYPVLNFKGFAVGNPYTNPYTARPAMFETFWGHQLISRPLWYHYKDKCGAGAYHKANVSI